MAPNISIRTFIQWHPEPPTEPTTTIVLTSSQRRFVDIRILNSEKTGTEREALLPSWRIDWAFAGVSDSHPSESKPDSNECKWTHWIDSRREDSTNVVDEGIMGPPDPETGVQLEHGNMANPVTGRMTDYTEGWRDADAVATKPEERQHGKVCMVLELRDEQQRAHGMVARVGQFVQGVIRVGEFFALERWSWQDGEGEGWKLDVKVGDLWLPCGVCMEGMLDAGGKVEYGVYEWKVVEKELF